MSKIGFQLESDSQGEDLSEEIEAIELDQATLEPESLMEISGDVAQAEVIETVINDLATDLAVNSVGGSAQTPGEAAGNAEDETIIKIDHPAAVESADASVEVDMVPTSVMHAPGLTDPGESVNEEDEVFGKIEHPAIEISATPINTPGQTIGDPTADIGDEPQLIDHERPEQIRAGVEAEVDVIGEAGIETPGIPGFTGLPEDGEGSGGSVMTGGPSEINGEDFNPADFENAFAEFEAMFGEKPWSPGDIGGGPGDVHPKYGASGQGMISDGSAADGANPWEFGGFGTDEEVEGDSSDQGNDIVFEADEGTVLTTDQTDLHRQEILVMDAAGMVDDAKEYHDANDSLLSMEMYVEAQMDFASKWATYKQMTGQLMPRPDSDGESDTSLTPDDVKHEELVSDPAIMQGGPHSSGVDERKMDSAVSDPAEWQEADTPDGGVKYDPGQVSDPPGDQAGKDTGKS